MYNSQAAFESALSYSAFPGPYHPDYLQKFHNVRESYSSPLHEAPGDREENGIDDIKLSERRRMSTMKADSTSEPPSSSISASCRNHTEDSLASMTSQSQHLSLEFLFWTCAHDLTWPFVHMQG